MSEENATVVNPVVQQTIDTLTKSYAEWLESATKRAQETFNAMEILKSNGVKGVPDADIWNLRYGFTIEVTEPSQWGKIHHSVGKLYVADKEPVRESDSEKKRGKKKQMIKIFLRPENKMFNDIRFSTERQLTKNDRCQVKTITQKTVQVVCTVNKS